MAKALSGCVIVKDQGFDYSYQKKCEKCGYLVPGVNRSGQKKGRKNTSSSICPKCRAQIKIVILEE